MRSIPGEEMEQAFLSIDHVEVKVNKKGETSNDENSLWKYVVLTSEQRNRITERLHNLVAALNETAATQANDSQVADPQGTDSQTA